MKLIIANLKMNLNNDEIKKYLDFFKNKKYSNVFFAPSAIYLTKFVDSGLQTVAQDVSPFENGAYTGDISSSQLKSNGVNYSLVGHSERRKYYQDSSFVNQKIVRLLEQGIVPILCIGETHEERENNQVFEVLKKEINDAFNCIKKDSLQKVIIAYEPIWSIGTGKIPQNKEIMEVVKYVKEYVKENYSFDVNVLYGGSVNPKCIDELEKINNVDGYLVGGCSLKCEDFNKVINSVK